MRQVCLEEVELVLREFLKTCNINSPQRSVRLEVFLAGGEKTITVRNFPCAAKECQ